MDAFKENCFWDDVSCFFVGGGDNDGLSTFLVGSCWTIYRVLFIEGFRGPQGYWPSDYGGYACCFFRNTVLCILVTVSYGCQIVTVSYSYHAGVVMLLFNATYTDSSIVVRYNSTMFDEGYASLPMVIDWPGCDCVVTRIMYGCAS